MFELAVVSFHIRLSKQIWLCFAARVYFSIWKVRRPAVFYAQRDGQRDDVVEQAKAGGFSGCALHPDPAVLLVGHPVERGFVCLDPDVSHDAHG